MTKLLKYLPSQITLEKCKENNYITSAFLYQILELHASKLKSRYIIGVLLNFTANQKPTAFFSSKSYTESGKVTLL